MEMLLMNVSLTFDQSKCGTDTLCILIGGKYKKTEILRWPRLRMTFKVGIDIEIFSPS